VGKSYVNDTASLTPSTRGSYYSMEALHDFIRPGDTFISSSSSQTTTGIVYAAKRPDGTIALMIINPNSAAQVIPVTISGGTYSTNGIQFLTSLTADPVQSLVSGLGNSFSVNLAASSMAVYLLTAVPEPSSLFLLLAGGVVLGVMWQRRPRRLTSSDP
jgi:hypothetical protein